MSVTFTSILDDVGHALKKFFSVATKVAVAAEPIIDLALPGISVLYNATVTEVVNAENAAIAAGAQSGTGAQKFAAVVAAVTPTFNTYLASQGIPPQPATTIEAWINAAVAGINAIPAASTSTIATPPPTATLPVKAQVASGTLL